MASSRQSFLPHRRALPEAASVAHDRMLLGIHVAHGRAAHLDGHAGAHHDLGVLLPSARHPHRDLLGNCHRRTHGPPDEGRGGRLGLGQQSQAGPRTCPAGHRGRRTAARPAGHAASPAVASSRTGRPAGPSRTGPGLGPPAAAGCPCRRGRRAGRARTCRPAAAPAPRTNRAASGPRRSRPPAGPPAGRPAGPGRTCRVAPPGPRRRGRDPGRTCPGPRRGRRGPWGRRRGRPAPRPCVPAAPGRAPGAPYPAPTAQCPDRAARRENRRGPRSRRGPSGPPDLPFCPSGRRAAAPARVPTGRLLARRG
mmetsp:Transcript_3736/g.7818  ORF Transcript_3736/g.7818 Transcript_3736/m.7818 type:complete len:309 (-) Transcript_3736:483-1409(-)